MFAILAALAFLVALFERTVFDGQLDLVVFGLFCIALHLCIPLNLPGRRD